MPFLPPDQPPPVLFDTSAQVATPAVQVHTADADTGSAAPLGAAVFRDTIFETQLRLVEGDDNDRYGIFVRRASTGRFVSCCISPAGVLAVRMFDGVTAGEVAGGELARGMSFAPGLDAANVFHVVACGPQLTFVLNGMVLMGLTVGPSLAEGELGVLVEHGHTSPAAAAAADWGQVRAVLPPMRRAPG